MKVKFKRMVTVDLGRQTGEMDDVNFRSGQVVEVNDMNSVGSSLVDLCLTEGVALGVPRDAFEVIP